jgi:hypothetical protein
MRLVNVFWPSAQTSAFHPEWHGVCIDIEMMGHLGFLLFTAGTVVASPISNHCAFSPQ